MESTTVKAPAAAVFQRGEHVAESVTLVAEVALTFYTNCLVQSRHVSDACIQVYKQTYWLRHHIHLDSLCDMH